jgi:DNA-binding transcriptional regulator YdaS (Cro superfamily)
MTLREYLFRNNMTAAEMARQLGIHANYFRMINRGSVRPGYELSLRIEIMTGGQVTINELRKKP